MGSADAGADTIEADVTALEQQSTSPWLIRFRCKNTARVHIRLSCFHYAGASASIFRSWDEAMPDGIEVVAVQLPGREYRLDESLLTDLQGIAGAPGHRRREDRGLT